MIDHLHDETSDRPCKCEDCGKITPERALQPIHNLSERVGPGEPMPVGECPDCGALCHHAPDFAKLANPQMRNMRMRDKLMGGTAIDVSAFPREGDYYVLDAFAEGIDYCDAKDEVWIWSIGKRLADNVILASRRGDLYQNPAFECLWLR